MISVIIPAYNEGKNISAVLDSLVKQVTKQKFEVVLVDNNSTDDTLKVARKYLHKLNMKIVIEKTQGRGAAKAKGAREAKGEILAFLDADSRAAESWIDTISNCFNDIKTQALTGPWRIYDLPDGFTKWFLHTFQETAMLPVRLYLGTWHLNGMNMAIRKGVYKKTGGFDTRLNVHDDFDLARRVRRCAKIKYSRDLIVTTSGRRYRGGIIAGLMSYHKGSINYLLGKRADLPDIR